MKVNKPTNDLNKILTKQVFKHVNKEIDDGILRKLNQTSKSFNDEEKDIIRQVIETTKSF